MTPHRRLSRVVGLSVICCAILSVAPSLVRGQTALYVSSVQRVPTRSPAWPAPRGVPAPSPVRPPAPTTAPATPDRRESQPAGEVSITVDLRGSFSVLPDGDVAVARAGKVLAVGSAHQAVSFSAGGPVELVVTATGLLDQPSVRIDGVALAQGGQSLAPTVSMVTGLVRVEATIGGRRVSGVARFYRLDPVTGQAEPLSCGSTGATGVSREISAGRYLVTLSSSGQTLSGTVEITGGDTRLVRLQG